VKKAGSHQVSLPLVISLGRVHMLTQHDPMATATTWDLVRNTNSNQRGVVVHTCNPNTQVQGQPELCGNTLS
jgi:hypothetical protein